MAQNGPSILDKPEDWPLWLEDIKGAIPSKIWKLIDPDAENQAQMLPEPVEPRQEQVNPPQCQRA